MKNGNVWCTGKNLFQETMGLGAMMQDLHRLFSQERPDPSQMTYLRHLE